MGASVASDAYAEWVEQWIARGFAPYILTFMFLPLPGGPDAALALMKQLVEQAYSLHVKRAVRKPMSPASRDHLPIWLLVPDFPVYKRAKQLLRDVQINGGLHIQGFALEPYFSPLFRASAGMLTEHFQKHEALYTRHCFGIDRIHVQPIGTDVRRVSEYLLKSIHRGLVDPDDLMILPKERSEIKRRR